MQADDTITHYEQRSLTESLRYHRCSTKCSTRDLFSVVRSVRNTCWRSTNYDLLIVLHHAVDTTERTWHKISHDAYLQTTAVNHSSTVSCKLNKPAQTQIKQESTHRFHDLQAGSCWSGAHIGKYCFGSLLYADDILLSHSVTVMQLILGDFSYTTVKSVALRTGPCCTNICAPLMLSGSKLAHAEQTKYLGDMFKSARSFKCMLDHVKVKFYRCFNAIFIGQGMLVIN